MNLEEKYIVNKHATEDILSENGFRHGVFKCFVYKDIIQLIVRVDLEEQWWGYQVYNLKALCTYHPYYDRGYGKHLELEEIDRKVNKIMRELEKAKILKKKFK